MIAGSLTLLLAGAAGAGSGVAKHPIKRNVIIFVADGLRRGSVNATDTPTLARLRTDGVDFANSHSLFPTFTTANASGIATGHYLGDTGDFANSIYVGFAVFGDGKIAGEAPGTPVPFLENDRVLADVDEHFAGGNYLDEESLLALARRHGYNTAAIGKLGPVAIQDVTQLNPVDGAIPARDTIFVDDSTGHPGGIPLSARARAMFVAGGVNVVATPRHQPHGDVATPGTLTANIEQQRYFVEVAIKAILPGFKSDRRPFALVFWSRDPDGSQHNQGDSLNTLAPGINGPTSRAGVANADSNLRQIMAFLEADPELAANTDVFVTSDHGFATISKHEVDAAGHGSDAYATRFTYLGAANDPAHPDVEPGWLPPGFLAIDIAHALSLPLFDPDSDAIGTHPTQWMRVDPTRPNSTDSIQRPVNGNGMLGGSGSNGGTANAAVVVAANGGSDLIYVPDHDAERVREIVEFLAHQDYTGGLFVDSSYGTIPGALPLTAIGFEGSSLTPRPSIVIAFKTFSLDPADPLQTAIQIADTTLQEGQGMHGSLGRDNTYNNMAARGPDFKRHFIDRTPVGNADIMMTLARVLGFDVAHKGKLQGRFVAEAIRGGGAAPASGHRIDSSTATDTGQMTVLEHSTADGRDYYDAACFAGAAHIHRRHGTDALCD